MKILLASKEKLLVKTGYGLLGIPKDELRIGYIDTALAVVEDIEYLAYMREYEDEMVSAGIHFEKFDIRGKTTADIRAFFADKNVVQVSGGSPFYLLKHIRESGFEVVLKELLAEGLSYAGCSSAAYVMCPTLEVAGWKASRNRHGMTDFTALGYVPFLIKCHYTADQREKITEYIQGLNYPLRLLTDKQAFLIENDKCTFVGEGEEVVL